MKLKIGLVLAMYFCLLGTEKTLAHEPGTEAWTIGCNNPFSHDPRCWERGDDSHNTPYICPPRSFCGQIARVDYQGSGGYRCRSNEGLPFSCDALVAERGRAIEGLPVRLFVEYVDGCHAPGVCGPRGCVPNKATADYDPTCS